MAHFLQFDFAEPSGFAAPCRFTDPAEIVSANQVEEVVPALRRVQAAVDAGMYAAGFVAYEAAPAFDAAMVVPGNSCLPLVWFGLYVVPTSIEEEETSEGAATVGEWAASVGDARFRADIAAIRESIAAGDVYQVNHTQRLRAAFDGDAFAWYNHLRAAQGGAFSAYLDLGRFQILSLSPELFFQTVSTAGAAELRADGPNRPPFPQFWGGRASSGAFASGRELPERTIVTRPMKGTHPRGRWTDEDHDFQERLRFSEKDRAENLMIVDLLRNDLGRIARTGTVAVDALFEIERYPTLFQMTSTISARLDTRTRLAEIFGALFPCGSVTGAPKIAAMRRIADLEPEARGVYCGAIGYLEPGGRAVFSVAIRTLVIDKETNVAEYGVGSGITWESRADAEAAENRLKAAVLKTAPARPDLFETLSLRNGIYNRSELHLARILASAAYFSTPADPERLRAALVRQAQEHSAGLWRVRLWLSTAGQVSAATLLLEDPPNQPRIFALASHPVDRSDRMLFHKTADRETYAARKAERPDVHDVLMQNGQGELTEFTTGNLVLQIGGERFTPPLDCGLLPGVFRAELLASGELRERVLIPADLERAEWIWLINSLRGWVPMTRASM